MNVVLFLSGILVGIIISTIVSKFKHITGVIKIDRSNPEKDVYRICLDKLDDLYTKKHIWLRVDPNADLSQEEQPLL